MSPAHPIPISPFGDAYAKRIPGPKPGDPADHSLFHSDGNVALDIANGKGVEPVHCTSSRSCGISIAHIQQLTRNDLYGDGSPFADVEGLPIIITGVKLVDEHGTVSYGHLHLRGICLGSHGQSLTLGLLENRRSQSVGTISVTSQFELSAAANLIVDFQTLIGRPRRGLKGDRLVGDNLTRGKVAKPRVRVNGSK